MCEHNPRNCALDNGHVGVCVGAFELNRIIDEGIRELMGELEK